MFPGPEASRGMGFGHVHCFAARSSLTVVHITTASIIPL